MRFLSLLYNVKDLPGWTHTHTHTKESLEFVAIIYYNSFTAAYC